MLKAIPERNLCSQGTIIIYSLESYPGAAPTRLTPAKLAMVFSTWYRLDS